MTKETKVKDVYEDPAVVAAMVNAYQAAGSQEERDTVVAKLADEYGKTLPSVRGKLVREGVYISKEYKTKAGAPVVNKTDLVTQIEEAFGFEVGDLETLEKANKVVLTKILRATQDLVNEIVSDSEIEASDEVIG